ncbi:MAG TPA: peptidoglycan-binding protein [Solirubrobacteraceae bacterium]|nr:peptidoglycan-binding protein [Solirubrobacteraceae bacterium]
MQSTYAAPLARLGPLAMALIVLGLMAMPVPAQAREAVAAPSAGWHGRAIQNPRPRPQLVRASWPHGWSAGSVGLGTGYRNPGGSKRVREVQRRLVQLGYRPGPVDGLFGPRTRASTRWFQFKHGLPVTGSVNRSTLVVLRARSRHEPLPTTKRQAARNPVENAVTPLPNVEPGDAVADDVSVTWLLAGLLILLALGLGVLASLLAPKLRRDARTTVSAPTEPTPAPQLPAPAPAPVPAAPRRRPPSPRTAPRVLGYAVVDTEGEDADTATAALALRCTHRGWSLAEVIHDRRDPNRPLGERPGLKYALDTIRSRAAAGLVVARLRDFTGRIIDLATLLKWLDEADAFLGAADHELDTSTRAGRGTAGAIIELGRWERRRISERTREDLARGRFTPADGATRADLTREIAAMHEHGLSFRAIADALNLAGIPAPPRQSRWETADIKAATEESTRS